MRFVSACIAILSWGATPAIAQVGLGPIASPFTSNIPAPRDHAFRGEIRLQVDATDTDHGIFRVTESIPVQSPREMVLLYPEWETTSHSATASAVEFAGLHIESEGSDVAWRRDPFNIHAFHIAIPTGAQTLSIRFDYLPRLGGEIRPSMIALQWQRMLLYPAGWYARDIAVSASLALPAGFRAFTALAQQSKPQEQQDNPVSLAFAPESLDRLIDAPVYAGRYVRQMDLKTTRQSAVHLDVLSDAEGDLRMAPATVTPLRALITQTEKVFGPPPFSHYDVLVSLSDELTPGGGQEHLEEGENNMPANFFTDYAHQLSNRDLIAHEYIHAWNGRYRQPAGLWSPTFNQPTDPSLLWVYEGQTEFWGRVLAARSGMRTYQETLDKLALDAALVANRPGREWKNLADSTLDALYMPGHSPTWRDWQRREDYYPEGVLLWLDVDARLRELSQGKVTLDDFARQFFAAHGRSEPTTTYTFEDVCAALDALVASDWKSFLQEHLATHDMQAVMAGLKRAGWKLAYTSVPTETFQQDQAEAGVVDLSYSIGLQARENGTVRAVVWNGPAFRAGMKPGSKITKVNGHAFTTAVLLSAISASAQEPIHLSVQSGNIFRDVTIPYAGTLRYPKLERIPGTSDLLTPLLSSR
jgi:predicted metalloprotease with PDZ domain